MSARTPAGVPTGGQFAATARPEAAVGLHDRDARPAYQVAADDWLQDRTSNPDGWLADGEALLAIEEAAYDEERSGGDPDEAYRRAWRHSRDRFAEHGRAEDAAFMVAIEQEVARRAARAGR